MPTGKLWCIVIKEDFLTTHYSDGEEFLNKNDEPIGPIQTVKHVKTKDRLHKSDSIKVSVLYAE